jgi:hypothetical protein
MELDFPKVGDVAFEQAWNGIVCQALLVEAEEWESYAQIRITQEGTLRWSSPRVETNDVDMAFGTWADGNGLPTHFEDLDCDGNPEMLAMTPKADMSPTIYRVFRWNGDKLSLVRRASLVRQENGDFHWTEVDPEDEGQLAWIDYFMDGKAQVVHRRRATFTRSSVVVKPTPRGFAAVT